MSQTRTDVLPLAPLVTEYLDQVRTTLRPTRLAVYARWVPLILDHAATTMLDRRRAHLFVAKL